MGHAHSVSIQKFLILLCLYIKSVTLESNIDVYMQNNTVEYDHWFYI